MNRTGILLLAALTLAVSGLTAISHARSNDEAQIRALEQGIQDAMKAKDVAGVMKFYAPGNDLVVFDVVPYRQYTGYDAEKKTLRTSSDCSTGRRGLKSAISVSLPATNILHIAIASSV